MSHDRPAAGPAALPVEGHRSRGPLLVVLAAVCWGTGGLAGSVLGDVSGLSPVAVGAYRLVVAAVVLLALHAARGRLGDLLAVVVTLARRPADAGRVVGVGAGLALFQLCYFLAVEAVGVSVATMLTLGLAPVLVTGGAALLLGERVGTRLRVVLPVAVVGLVLLVGAGGGAIGGDGRTAAGAVLACTSATGYAAVTLLGRSLAARVPSESVTSLGFVVAALLALPVGLTVGMSAPPAPVTVALVLYLGVVPTALAYGLFFAGLRGTASGTASVLTLAEPLTATVLSVALLGERLGPWQWVGAGLLAAGVVVLSLGGGSARRLPSAGGRTRARAGRDER
ncbi:DMT family transporter [Aquipuribacter sp. MA13-6]|uniref:DMT family transporter n=1 Tax=unclassified Aquipuribacter TaxID=2635084 RepID=UPI003EE828D2